MKKTPNSLHIRSEAVCAVWLARVARTLALCALVGCAASATATVTFKVDKSQRWIGYINVFDLPQDGGNYLAGAAWDTADLTAGFCGTSLTLGPNFISYIPGDPFWVNPDGSPNKSIEANFYVERFDVSGQIVFSGQVQANTLVAPYTAAAFIKRFAPGFLFLDMTTVPLVGGSGFEATLEIQPGEILQYGFMLTGPNANPATLAGLGNLLIRTEPEPGQTVLSYHFDTGVEGFENFAWRSAAPAGWPQDPSVQQTHTAGDWQMWLTKEFLPSPGGGSENQQLTMQALANLGNARISFEVMADLNTFLPAAATWHQFWLVGNSDGNAGWAQTQLIDAWQDPDRPDLRTWHFDLSFSELGWEPGDIWFQFWTGANSYPEVPVNYYLDNVRVYVKTAAEQIADLRNTVNGMGILPGLANSLDVKLQAAGAALARGNTVATCGVMQAFLGEVSAQAAKKQITMEMAQRLWTEATRIRAATGCGN
jgi:hypothetical protein